jgi:hypothetical protein
VPFSTEFDTDVIADGAELWDFRSPLAGGAYSVGGGLLTLTVTGSPGTNRDTVTHTTSVDNSIAATHPFTPSGSGGPNHSGAFFVVAELATDVGWRKAWGISILAMPAAGQASARACIFKAGNNESEFPSWFASCRNVASNGVALNTSVNGAAWQLMTGQPAYLGLQHTPITGAPLSADMPAAGIYRTVYSVDGFTWVPVTGIGADFEPNELRFGFTKGGTPGNAGPYQLARVVDMLALGSSAAAWDLRRAHPTHGRQLVYGWTAGDGPLNGAFWQDDSASPGGTSTVTPGPTGLTFAHTLTPDARQGVRARLRWTGPTVAQGRLTVRARCPGTNANAFVTLGLISDLGTPPQVPLSSASRAANVLTLGTSAAHNLKQGQLVRAVFPNDPTFNVTGSPAASASGSAMTIAQTGADDPSIDTTGGAYLQKVEPFDQYTRGPGQGLEIALGAPAGVNVRRPIRMDWRGADYTRGDADVFSVVGSTGLEETGYQHSRQIDDLASTSTNPNLVVVWQLERFNTDKGHRYRVRRWASVSADIPTDIAHGDATGVPWDYIDSEDQISPAMGYALFGPGISLSHNATQTGTASWLASYVGFEELVEGETVPLPTAVSTSTALALGAAEAAPLPTATSTGVAVALGASEAAPLPVAVSSSTAMPLGGNDPDPQEDTMACLWPLPPTGCPLDMGSPAVTGMALQAASEMLFELSGHQFGGCAVTIRPCRADCSSGPSWGWWSGAHPWTAGVPWPGSTLWLPAGCGRCGEGSCSCNAADSIRLPELVQSVTQVTIDGAVLDPSAYNLFDGYILVRADGERWPMCQDWTVPVSGVGAWTITAVVGRPVPMLGRLALAQLTAEYAKWCTTGQCKMPAYTTGVARQGVTQQFPTVKELRELGITGWAAVDNFLQAFNDDGLRKGDSIRIWDPDSYANGWRTPGGVT